VPLASGALHALDVLLIRQASPGFDRARVVALTGLARRARAFHSLAQDLYPELASTSTVREGAGGAGAPRPAAELRKEAS
jgi:translation initiation factor 1 (eIF-1/SUI1)